MLYLKTTILDKFGYLRHSMNLAFFSLKISVFLPCSKIGFSSAKSIFSFFFPISPMEGIYLTIESLHFQHTCCKKEITDIGAEKRKNSGRATGDRTYASGYAHQRSDHWAINLQPLTALNIPLLDVYQCRRCAVGWLQCCSLQPTAADTMRSYVVYGLTKNKSYC